MEFIYCSFIALFPVVAMNLKFCFYKSRCEEDLTKDVELMILSREESGSRS